MGLGVTVSSWWKDISLMGAFHESSSDWFSTRVRKVIGNGLSTSFRSNPWLGEVPLKDQFLRLFQVSINHDAQVGSFGRWDVSLSMFADSWFCKFESSGVYSVKSAYMSLICEFQGVTLLQDRISYRQNLLRRRVLATPESAICALCGLSGELSVHLFISCPVVSSAWFSVSYWLGWEYVSLRDLLGHFEAFVRMGVDRISKSIFSLVWHTVVWSIWKSRNDVIFSRRPFSVVDLVDRAKRSSWIWFSSKILGHPCFLYEWGVGTLPVLD
ncbi:hypothetical protein TSUD_143850 [Trifolium subterraneum]|uniref:Reverse transcriptase zinc-binding domain-containing protein n=1 Tax=Trifolium subterraneum TaxID=3900 RepID=A0A2Z6NM84_TRISU|nr:hypothetical protein TSUD_143850 [Trifolium subterraneum]